jgi:hypothetical protein
MYIKTGIKYYTGKDFGLKIEKIGTNSSGDAYLWIGNDRLGAINSLIAPIHRTSSNLLGPLDLRDKYYYIPPNKDFTFTGDSGSLMRLIGKIVRLEATGEVPPEAGARGATQTKNYMTYVQGTASLGTNVALPKDGEILVLSLTPSSIETYVFSGPIMVSVDNYTPSEGDLALRFFLDSGYLDNLTDLPGTDIRGGIDIKNLPRPPADTTEEDVFTLLANPITVVGPHTLKLYIRNTKGADISPASGTALSFTVTAIVEYLTS